MELGRLVIDSWNHSGQKGEGFELEYSKSPTYE